MPAPGRRARRRRRAAIVPSGLGAGRRSSTRCANGRVPRRAPGACCPGCPSRSAPASRSILPPNMSRCSPSRPLRRSRFARWRCCCGGKNSFRVVVMIAAIAAGFAVATWKTARVAHGVLARPMYSVSLTGFVETRDIRERTDRFVLRVATMESPRGDTKLERVRLSVRKGTAPAVGSFVELKARLQPPLAPLRPGSYDFGRDLYFQGIGASGFVHRRDQDHGAAGQRRAVVALRRVHAGIARRDRCAHSQRAGRRPARDRDRAADRTARCDLHARQRCDVHLRPRSRAVDLGLSHGGRCRRGVLCGAGAAGAVSRAHRRAFRSRNGRPPPRLLPPRSISCCRAPRSRRNDRSS